MEDICPKNHENPKYNILHYQFDCSGYNFTIIATIWIEQAIHHPFLLNRLSERTNRTQELGQNRKNKLDLRCHEILKICPN